MFDVRTMTLRSWQALKGQSYVLLRESYEQTILGRRALWAIAALLATTILGTIATDALKEVASSLWSDGRWPAVNGYLFVLFIAAAVAVAIVVPATLREFRFDGVDVHADGDGEVHVDCLFLPISPLRVDEHYGPRTVDAQCDLLARLFEPSQRGDRTPTEEFLLQIAAAGGSGPQKVKATIANVIARSAAIPLTGGAVWPLSSCPWQQAWRSLEAQLNNRRRSSALRIRVLATTAFENDEGKRQIDTFVTILRSLGCANVALVDGFMLEEKAADAQSALEAAIESELCREPGARIGIDITGGVRLWAVIGAIMSLKRKRTIMVYAMETNGETKMHAYDLEPRSPRNQETSRCSGDALRSASSRAEPGS